MTPTITPPTFQLYPAGAKAAETATVLWRRYFEATTAPARWWVDQVTRTQETLMSLTGVWPSAPASAPALTAIAAPEPEPVPVAEPEPAVMETAAEIEPEPVVEAELEPEPAPAESFAIAPDDLTRLVGIGPKLAMGLAERGVVAFSQIAAWTEDDLVDVDKALDLKGRAVRDAWVAQAKRFAASTEGATSH